MKTILLAAALILSSGAAWAAERSVTLDIQNMTCALCPITVSTAIKGVEGVRTVDVNFEAKTATVVFDDAVANVDTVAQASTNAGYPASQ